MSFSAANSWSVNSMWAMVRIQGRNRAWRGRNTARQVTQAEFGCCNTSDRVVGCGCVSIIIGALSIAYATYEMHRAGKFYDHEITEPVPIDEVMSMEKNVSTPTPKRIKYFDKYGAEVTEEKYYYLLGQKQVDKGLCVALTLISVVHVVTCAFIIRGVKILPILEWFWVTQKENDLGAQPAMSDTLHTLSLQRDKRAFVPWMIVALILIALGMIHVMFNIITLDFNANVNFVLFMWIVACVIELQCLKHVLRVYRGQNQNGRPIQEGVAIFDARQLHNDLFTISDGRTSQAASPVRLVLKPPTYDEALHELEELGPPPDPPDYAGGSTPEQDKPPPKYTP